MDDELRRGVAVVTGVTLSTEDDNPWGLPSSDEPSAWGVSLNAAKASFGDLCETITGTKSLVFEFKALREIPFGLYEEEIEQLAESDAVVAISFDYAQLQTLVGGKPPRRRAHHVVRLTPKVDEASIEPNVRSPEFGFEYDGALNVFDDTGEMGGEGSLLEWRKLIQAAEAVDGGLWVVRRER